MGSLIKMKIVAFRDGKFQKKVSDYGVMINPEAIKWDRSVDYNRTQAPDSGKPSVKYKKSLAQNLSFDLVLDCTGVVDSSRLNLPAELKKLKDVVYAYKGNTHRPNFLSIHWGRSFSFQGVLTNYDISYDFFKPDGTPLRAKVSLKFISYTDLATVVKQENKQSPDMTHQIRLVAGDSLPQLCESVYDSTDYVVQLAEYNGLNKFRHLKPGQTLQFPPLLSGAQT